MRPKKKKKKRKPTNRWSPMLVLGRLLQRCASKLQRSCRDFSGGHLLLHCQLAVPSPFLAHISGALAAAPRLVAVLWALGRQRRAARATANGLQREAPLPPAWIKVEGTLCLAGLGQRMSGAGVTCVGSWYFVCGRANEPCAVAVGVGEMEIRAVTDTFASKGR